MGSRLVAAAAISTVALVAVGSACDNVTTAGQNWVFTPDIAMHIESQLGGSIRFAGLCSNGSVTWWSRTPWENLYFMYQGQTMVAHCAGGWPVGGDNWGVEHS